MASLHERYAVNEKGERVSLLLDREEYKRLLEELEAIREYDAAKASSDEIVPFDQAVTEMESERA